MHEIRYSTYPITISKESIMKQANEIAYSCSDGNRRLDKDIRFISNKVYDSYDDAKKAIKDMDTGWYDQIAVQFKSYDELDPTKKEVDLKSKLTQHSANKLKYIESNSVRNKSAAFLSCSECGSKLSANHLHGEYCPLCKADLRSNTIQEKIKWYDKKTFEFKNKIHEEELKRNGKAKINWLVKIEYHT